MSEEALNSKLKMVGLPEGGSKAVLIARLETWHAGTYVKANRVKLESASDTLRQLVASSVNGRLEMPTTSIQAIQLLWLALLFGTHHLENGPACFKVKEVALELAVLADQLGLDEIAEEVSRCILTHWLLTEAQSEGARWAIPLFVAAERHPTAGTLWDGVRTHVSNWVNTCGCSRCGGWIEATPAAEEVNAIAGERAPAVEEAAAAEEAEPVKAAAAEEVNAAAGEAAGEAVPVVKQAAAAEEDSSVPEWAEAHCRIRTCGVEQLSYEALVKLVDLLAVERAADVPQQQFEWAVPAGMPAGSTWRSAIMTLEDFSFRIVIWPTGGQKPDQAIVTHSMQPHRIRCSYGGKDSRFTDCLVAIDPNDEFEGLGATECDSNLDFHHVIGEDGIMSGKVTLILGQSTARRDMLMQWAHGNGLSQVEKTEAALLHFFATQYSLNEVVSNALLCHMAPAFCVDNAAQFAQLPVTVMVSLLGRDDLNVTSEIEVVNTLAPWIVAHNCKELQRVVHSLRLAWIPPKELVSLLTTGLLSTLKGDTAVKQLVEEALDSQTRSAGKRRRMAEPPPDEFLCPITQEIMSDPVIAADGHTYERAAIARWLSDNDRSPKTNLVLLHKHLTPNHGLKSLTQHYIEVSNACEQRVHKRANFSSDEIPQAISRLDLLTNANDNIQL